MFVGYLGSRADTAATGGVAGDAARGKTLFETKGACITCHRVAGTGSRVGPDLTSIGAVRQAAELHRALVEPDADVQPTNRFFRATLKDGTRVEGRLLGHDTYTVQLLDTKENLRSFQKTDLREATFLPSPMPSYSASMSPQEIADIVSYLTSLRNR
jgi:quinoprotein glucose dehydrogenase